MQREAAGRMHINNSRYISQLFMLPLPLPPEFPGLGGICLRIVTVPGVSAPTPCNTPSLLHLPLSLRTPSVPVLTGRAARTDALPSIEIWVRSILYFNQLLQRRLGPRRALGRNFRRLESIQSHGKMARVGGSPYKMFTELPLDLHRVKLL
ncbi:hypothetical protein RRG08_025957 [Elysia crispata]|uniref:Uncharacterized protein n=1 Tax=Elysia crispata TaxID=231223 RepID=A0AAE0ZFW8_9GAST|nr:hypothetical protein RRG08_025957 [Elysia crispata]